MHREKVCEDSESRWPSTSQRQRRGTDPSLTALRRNQPCQWSRLITSKLRGSFYCASHPVSAAWHCYGSPSQVILWLTPEGGMRLIWVLLHSKLRATARVTGISTLNSKQNRNRTWLLTWPLHRGAEWKRWGSALHAFSQGWESRRIQTYQRYVYPKGTHIVRPPQVPVVTLDWFNQSYLNNATL